MSEDICKKIIEKKSNLAVVGLGYVGMPIAVAFADRGVNVIGYDSNEEKISSNNKYNFWNNIWYF